MPVIYERIDERFAEPERVRGLAVELGCRWTEIDEGHDGNWLEYGKEEYWVLTEEEANEAWDEELNEYFDEEVLPAIPKHLVFYFDTKKTRERWKQDARMDGRGHALSPYDGSEVDVVDPVTGASFVVFRMN